MVQLKILSGKKAGTVYGARRFPVRIGRAPGSDLQVEEDGVWDQHLSIDFRSGEGFVLRAGPNSITTVNGEPVQETVLRNGDGIQIGSLKLQFWLSDTRQRDLRFREGLVWAGIALITLGQVALVYWLLG